MQPYQGGHPAIFLTGLPIQVCQFGQDPLERTPHSDQEGVWRRVPEKAYRREEDKEEKD